jgi:hypothetical protein
MTRSDRATWGMRHSVQMLKMTESILAKLQHDAIDVTFHAAAVVCAQSNAVGRRRRGTPVKVA